jgi:hypothetical protein
VSTCHTSRIFNIQHSTFNDMKRRDLAKKYFPEMSDVEAVRSLRRWIEGCPKLMSALEELSMPFKKSRNLSARQVRIIMEYLGDP